MVVGQVGYGISENMNLALLNSGVDILRQSLIREGLWEYRGEQFGVENVLAESQELSKDGKTLTVKLRSGITWHNGKSFNADDVVWTIQQWKDTPSVAFVAGLIDLPRVRKIGDLSVAIPFKVATAGFPGIASSNWSTYIIQNGAKYTTAPYVGTGPFVLESFKPGKAIFTANKNYWGGAPYLDSVVSDSSFTNDQTRFNALSAGTIHAMPGLPFTMAGSANVSGVRLLKCASPGFTNVAIRVDQAPFSDPRVMEAMKLLVDREAIVTSVYDGYAQVGNDLGMKGVPYYASDLKRDHDPDKAKSLLKAAGADGLQASIITASFSAGATALATIYAQQAANVGLKLSVKQIDTSEFYNTSGPNAYLQRTMGMNSWSPTTLDGLYMLGLNSKAPYNDTHWGSPEGDALLADAIAEQNVGKAGDKWHAVQQAQFDRGGFIIPAHPDTIVAVRSNVQGLPETPAGNDFNNFDFSKAWLSA